MFFVMAALAVLLGVGARKLVEFIDWPGMTISAGLGKSLHGWDTQRRMGILMTVETVNLDGPMLLTVAHRAEWHQLVIVVFARAVCVNNFMTFLAGKAMFATRGF